MVSTGKPESATTRGTGVDYGLFRFLRFSHIFSSAVREILERRYLQVSNGGRSPLSLRQFHLLKLIALNGHHQVGEVADILGKSSPAVSKSIDKLEGLGMVARSPCEGDRRATLLSASPQGLDLVRRYEETQATCLEPILGRLQAGELEQITGLLEKLSVALFAEERSGQKVCLRCAAYCEEDCPISHLHGNCPYEKIRKRGAEPRSFDEEVS